MNDLWRKIRLEWQHPEEREFIFPTILALMILLLFLGPILRVHFRGTASIETLPGFLSQAVEAGLSFVLDFILMASIWAYAGRRRLTVVSFVFFLLSMGLLLVNLIFFPGHGRVEMAYLPQIPLLFIASFTLLRYLIRAETVSAGTLSGAVLCYLLLPMMFTQIYVFAWLADPAVLRGIEIMQHDAKIDIWSSALESNLLGQIQYFSMTTFTTLGYGDITPGSTVGRSLATGEAALGQIYVGIIIAKLVSLYMRASGIAQKDREE